MSSSGHLVQDHRHEILGKLISVPGGCFMMGSDNFYPEEKPRRAVIVKPFKLMAAPITNAQFALFVEETNYISSAERGIDFDEQPGFPPEFYRPGSMVFRKTNGPTPLNDPRRWWSFIEGACWRAPEGPNSTITGRMNHPVVHLSNEDAQSYATWVGARLPCEHEWEWAAHGGVETLFPWGDELELEDGPPANIWTGSFPWLNERHDDEKYTTPPGLFPANGYGLFDMIGNVWEWTSSLVENQPSSSACCMTSAHTETSVFAVKGGSFLCAANYCQRYRPTARMLKIARTTACNIGFRLAV